MRRVLAVAFLSLTACVGSARTFPTYESKAAATAGDAIASVETARMVVRSTIARRTTANYATVVLSDAEKNASAVQGTFDLILPPDARSDALRKELDAMLSDVGDAIAALRIAGRRHEFARFGDILPKLDDVATRLHSFEKAHGG